MSMQEHMKLRSRMKRIRTLKNAAFLFCFFGSLGLVTYVFSDRSKNAYVFTSDRKVHLSEEWLTKNTELAEIRDERCLLVQSKTDAKSVRDFADRFRNAFLEPTFSVYRDPAKMITVVRKLAKSMSRHALEEEVTEDPCIVGISYNRHFEVSGDEVTSTSARVVDPYLRTQAHLPVTGFDRVYENLTKETLNPDMPEVVVAVIDTGIDTMHEDLVDALWTNTSEANGSQGVDDDGNGYVDDVHGFNFVDRMGDPTHKTFDDHGTHVSGFIAARLGNDKGGTGIAGPKSKIMALNVFGGNLAVDTVQIDEAIKYAILNGAKVINLSFGGFGRSDTTAEWIRLAVQKGIVVVASTGNYSTNIDGRFYSPAGYASGIDGFISVSALDVKTKGLCAVSNFGPRSTEIVAPGCDTSAPKNGLLSTRSGNRYGYRSGTSMATPQVAAALALGISHHAFSDASNAAFIEKEFKSMQAFDPVLSDRIEDGRALSFEHY